MTNDAMCAFCSVDVKKQKQRATVTHSQSHSVRPQRTYSRAKNSPIGKRYATLTMMQCVYSVSWVFNVLEKATVTHSGSRVTRVQ